MVGRLAYIRERLETSIWVIPVCLCAASATLAMAMLWVDRLVGDLPYFAMPVDSARQLLGVIAGSIISVGGVAFSVIIVALTLTSGQYGPKILRNFLDDNTSKLTLGLFLGTYVYTLIALTGFAPSDTPRFTVVCALLLAFFALIGFVSFIHHTATDLQADKIIHRIGGQLQMALRNMSREAGHPQRSEDTLAWRRAARPHRGYQIASGSIGYVQTIDYTALVDWCSTNDCLLQVRVRAGDFIVKGVCLFKVYSAKKEQLTAAVDELNGCVIVGPIRTPIQDPEYAITQLNQLAARALSPGINDPGTAITCIDWASLALSQIVDHDMPGCVFLDDHGQPRLLARISDFSGVLKAIYAPLRQFAQSEISVIVCLLESLGRLASLTKRADRLQAIALHGELIWEEAQAQNLTDYDISDIQQRHMKLTCLTQARPSSMM